MSNLLYLVEVSYYGFNGPETKQLGIFDNKKEPLERYVILDNLNRLEAI